MTTPEEKIKALEEQVATLTKSKKDVEIELKLALSREEKLKENYSIAVARHFRSSTLLVGLKKKYENLLDTSTENENNDKSTISQQKYSLDLLEEEKKTLSKMLKFMKIKLKYLAVATFVRPTIQRRQSIGPCDNGPGGRDPWSHQCLHR
jgi:phosphoenolpyruvate carboxylase